MNIALDIDDTITRAPLFFSTLARAVRSAGGRVHILSSRTASPGVLAISAKELRDWGIEFDTIYLLPGSAEAATRCPHADLDWYQKYIWQKVDYCLTHNVAIHFDDELKVIELFRRYAPQIVVFRPS